jgi:hypothetical protein
MTGPRLNLVAEPVIAIVLIDMEGLAFGWAMDI